VKVGLFGGTFDPIHLGHLEAAEVALDCAGLDEVLLVPAGRPPHKKGAHASAADRFEMCRLAVTGRRGLGVWDWEVARSGASYTVDTLRAFRELRPADEPFLILGWDAAREIQTWNEQERVLELARLVVVGRPGLASPTAESLRAAGLDPRRVTLCLIGTPDVAATRIRRLAAAGRPLDGLVPPPVADYIREHRLYGAPADNRAVGQA
jgi:nicotinate-nucleotide adenylyltransferase